MKIGILTVPFNNNYGGFLQAYSLKRVLLSMGHEVIFVNRKRNLSTSLLHKLKQCVNRFLIFLNIIPDDDFVQKKISIHTDRFKKLYLEPLTEAYYSSDDINKVLSLGIDFFIVGSDQVWRYAYAKDSISDYFFSFLRDTNIPRISYAASFGIDYVDYPSHIFEDCKNLLSQFKHVSVREKSAVQMIKDVFQVPNVDLVLDPTLLLSVDDYKVLFSNYSAFEAPTLFTYILDSNDENSNLINNILLTTGFRHYDIKAQVGKVKIEDPIKPVELWLSSIFYSSFVVTDSFHGTVFSILFNKPFIVYSNSQRGKSRIISLLSLFGLQDRCVDCSASFNKTIFSSTINWGSVNNKIYELKSKSLLFLNNSLIF